MSVLSKEVGYEQYDEAFIEITNNFYFEENDTINSKAQLIENTESEQKSFQDKLTEREKLGTTILNGEGIILMRCRSEVVSKPQIGVIRLKKQFTQWMNRVKI